MDHYELPALKIVNPDIRPSGTTVAYQFGTLGSLISYTMDSAPASAKPFALTAGTTFTLTTYFRARAPSPVALTRFIQVRNGEGQIIAQHDSEPQEGLNPTWAWTPEEIVRDDARLTLDSTAQPGNYTVYIGFYDAGDGIRRVEVTDAQGAPVANGEVALVSLEVQE
jgi:hypothetical protein